MIPTDISNIPDILRLAEQVYLTQIPQVLRRDHQNIAVVVPLAAAIPKQADDNIWTNYDPKRVQQALQKSAGALTGVDKKVLLYDISEQRSQKTLRRSV